MRAYLWKVHNVIVHANLCPCARMYLSQLFIQIGGVHLSPLSQLLVKHLFIPGNEIGAKKFLHLNRHIHRHRDDVIKQDHESQEVCERSDHLQGGGRQTAFRFLEKKTSGIRCQYYAFYGEVKEQTTWRWRSFSVLWLYQGSSRSGDHCQAYFRTVLITALLIRMHRQTIRNAFIDLQRQRVTVGKKNLGMYQSSKTFWGETFQNHGVKGVIILFYSGALLRFRLVIKSHLGLHACVDCNS